MQHERYHSLEALRPIKADSAESFEFRLPAATIKKLNYYAAASDEAVVELNPMDAVKDLIRSEGKNPDDYKSMMTELGKYEVVYPNMFLREQVDAYSAHTEFKPRGSAAERISRLAAIALQALAESNFKIHEGLDKAALAKHVQEYMEASLAGPFASIVDLGEFKPLLVLNDMSYTASQLFRAFSGVYCDFTPVLKLSRADFLEFAVFHEIGHKRTEKIIAEGKANTYLPGIELGVDQDAMSHKNLVESIADAYGVLKHIQRTGSDELPRQIALMRALSVFSHSFQSFETGFSLSMGSSSRTRSVSEYYTTPVIDQVIVNAMHLYKSGRLQAMSDAELTKLAVNIAGEMKPAAETLNELSAFATSLTFNARRYHENPNIPRHKDSISPVIIDACLSYIEKHGRFKPRGGSSLEGFFRRASGMAKNSGNLFDADCVEISPELKGVFTRYSEAFAELKNAGVQPFSSEAEKYFVEDIKGTLGLIANQTPNMTLAREANDSLASIDKCRALDGHKFELIGLGLMLKEAGMTADEKSDLSFDLSVAYNRGSDDKPRPVDLVLQMLQPQKNPAAVKIPSPGQAL